jgi:Protein of unknown function, DUF481
MAAVLGTSMLVPLATPPLAAPAGTRQDVVIMKNGDRITGEVKGMSSGVLAVKPDYVESNIGLDWNEVQRVESTATYQVTLVDGVRLTGTIRRELAKEGGAEQFTISGPGGDQTFTPTQIADISTKKNSFWRQLKGSIEQGYSFTSGNHQTTINTDATVTYETPKWTDSASLDTSFSGQSNASKTNRVDAAFFVARFLNRNSYLANIDDFLHSSQQDLNLRATLGGGYGRYWIRTSSTGLRWLGGAVYTQESFAGNSAGASNDSNVEAFAGVAYDSYRFRFGQLHLQAFVFPGLTDAGRVRTTTNNTLNIKLTNNFFFSVGFWDNFDSRPPQTTAKRNELGISSSIGWTF